MDFNDTPELAEFRAHVRSWLDANAERRTDKLHIGMEGEKAFLEAKDWYKAKADAGLACLTWPVEYGGAGLDPVSYALALIEISAADASHGTIMSVNNTLYCHGILKYGTEEQKQKFVRPIASGEATEAIAIAVAAAEGANGSTSDPASRAISPVSTAPDRTSSWATRFFKNSRLVGRPTIPVLANTCPMDKNAASRVSA